MVKTRQLLWISLICSILAVQAVLAQSLTQIQDTVTNPDGTPFNGTVVITWNGFTGSNNSGAPLSTSARVYNGALSVLLVPTTTASAGSFYQVVYYNSSGVIAWTETWQVPPSSTPLTISAVRTSSTSGGSTGGGTTTGGGGTTTGGGGITLPISMSQVTGLSSTLAALNSAIATLSAQLTNFMSSTTPTTNAAFVDAETPAGTMNGTNSAFTVSKTPLNGFALFRNGLLQSPGVDYTISGTGVTFLPNSVPKSTDILSAFYRISGIGPTARFVDAETPGGTIDGTNVTFTLANTPNPALSLKLFKNGILMTQNTDYSLNGSTVVFTANAMPVPGDSVVAAYRY
ncbi:MAG TPA: hypothetical protein VKX25_02375 [Bryobacteraceae bacterium]|jgi:hypothetical protein|nr:hypothetical protein [Bryobacteraceae bacterium]